MGSSPSEIRSNARRVYQLAEDVRREMQSLKRDMNQSSSYWAGQSQSAFLSQQGSITRELTSLVRDLEQCEGGLSRLASEVVRAEEERAEKKRLAELAAKQAKGK